jgi:hypothetical protein
MIECWRMNFEDLRSAFGKSIINTLYNINTLYKRTERSDIHQSSIVNLQSSIPVYPGVINRI